MSGQLASSLLSFINPARNFISTANHFELTIYMTTHHRVIKILNCISSCSDISEWKNYTAKISEQRRFLRGKGVTLGAKKEGLIQIIRPRISEDRPAELLREIYQSFTAMFPKLLRSGTVRKYLTNT